MTPNPVAVLLAHDLLRRGGDVLDLLNRGGVGHFGVYLGQHTRHSPVALGVAAELTLRAESVDSRAERGNGDGHHHEKSFPGPVDSASEDVNERGHQSHREEEFGQPDQPVFERVLPSAAFLMVGNLALDPIAVQVVAQGTDWRGSGVEFRAAYAHFGQRPFDPHFR